MESMHRRSSIRDPNVVVVAFDATRDRSDRELRMTFDGIRMRGDILCGGDSLLVLGVLHTVTNPMGYHMKASTDSFAGTSSRFLEEQVLKKVDSYISMLLQIAERCKEEGVSMNVKITAGTPTKIVILQEVISSKASWVVLDRYFRREMKFYLNHIPCKVALVQDSLSVEVPKPLFTKASTDSVSGQKFICSIERPVLPNLNTLEDGSSDQSIMERHVLPNLNTLEAGSSDQSIISCGSYTIFNSHVSSSVPKHSIISSSSSRSLELNDAYVETESSTETGKGYRGDDRSLNIPQASHKQNTLFQYDSSEKPILCTICGLSSVLYIKDSMNFRFSEIQYATSNFSMDNLLGEGGFGHVYKGQLQDGQIIAAKVRKEASKQGYSEFFSEVHVLSFARHRNIVMLLGYCCKENHNILVYEYICNKSLDWHLFHEDADMLEWHKRCGMAIGVAKGLRFLHEECRGGPIIHRDLRPSNILLTHDFIPMLGDFGLARWKSSDESFQTKVLGTSGYLAPEYAEYGTVSVRTDVYAFGIVLFQLISGRKVLDEKNGEFQHLLQWAEPLVEKLALHVLIDPRLGESYDTNELYHLARAAYLCVRRNPEMRPSMGEVVRLLEVHNNHSRDLVQQFIPHFIR